MPPLSILLTCQYLRKWGEKKKKPDIQNLNSVLTQNKGLHNKFKTPSFKTTTKNVLKKQIKLTAFSRTQCIWEFTLDKRLNTGAVRLNSATNVSSLTITYLGCVYASGGRRSTSCVTAQLQQPWVLVLEQGLSLARGHWLSQACCLASALGLSGITLVFPALLPDSWNLTRVFIFTLQEF